LADDVASHYDKVTQAWRFLLGADLHYGYFLDQNETLASATDGLTRLLAERAGIRGGDRVIDIGCGIGTPAMQIAQWFGCDVTGISISRVGVDLACERAQAAGLSDRVRFEVRDGMDTKLPDASFDCAWVMESSHLMPDKGRMIAEASRMLRPGGRVVLCDIIAHRIIPMSEVLRRARQFLTLELAFGRAKMETFQAYRGWFESAGLIVEDQLDISLQTRPTFDRWSQNAQKYANEVASLIGEQGLRQFRDSCDILRDLWDTRTLGYGLVRATKPSR
jgi:27-O-demethylrifamycin SV methyltransferase